MMVHYMRELAVRQIGNDKKISKYILLVVSSELTLEQTMAVQQTIEAEDKEIKPGQNPRLEIIRTLGHHVMVPKAYELENDLIYGAGGVREPDVRTLVLVSLEETFFGVDVLGIDSVYEKLARVDRRGEKYRFDEESADRVVMERLVEEFFLKDTEESLARK
ncbi:hypothetical protein BGZ96_003661 [Linnemannia gamsii]|uniref:Uncharacterized protein n=1 Tax=Linnemannia gamsii TaxID=64522 RepID=A0ABQ7K7F2_9FUNG|nr:hypothetical protein BGZ96_003661 [Linnemannia gamsii]